MRRIFLILLLLSINSYALDIVYQDDGTFTDFCGQQIYLIGEIKSTDGNKVVSSITSLKNKYKKKDCDYGPNISIHSNGGDVNSAMQIGRYIKKNNMNIQVSWGGISFEDNQLKVDMDKKGICVSSCVFILAGGVNRYIASELSKVGIHRPYFTNVVGNLSREQIKVMRDKLLQNIKSYLDEMDINPILADEMMSIPPEKIKFLTNDELTRYRLNIPDANNEESRIAKIAGQHNITSAEYRKRDLFADSQCKNSSSLGYDSECKNRIMLNITQIELERRRARAINLCPSDVSKEIHESCLIKIMVLGQ
jgi:hypothetical protein